MHELKRLSKNKKQIQNWYFQYAVRWKFSKAIQNSKFFINKNTIFFYKESTFLIKWGH